MWFLPPSPSFWWPVQPSGASRCQVSGKAELRVEDNRRHQYRHRRPDETFPSRKRALAAHASGRSRRGTGECTGDGPQQSRRAVRGDRPRPVQVHRWGREVDAAFGGRTRAIGVSPSTVYVTADCALNDLRVGSHPRAALVALSTATVYDGGSTWRNLSEAIPGHLRCVASHSCGWIRPPLPAARSIPPDPSRWNVSAIDRPRRVLDPAQPGRREIKPWPRPLSRRSGDAGRCHRG